MNVYVSHSTNYGISFSFFSAIRRRICPIDRLTGLYTSLKMITCSFYGCHYRSSVDDTWLMMINLIYIYCCFSWRGRLKS